MKEEEIKFGHVIPLLQRPFFAERLFQGRCVPGVAEAAIGRPTIIKGPLGDIAEEGSETHKKDTIL
ncbi:hypothetical protein [Paenibacillus sp. SN-8-1]|uniref:hypothetical protein n=1 Tax=Paenibacillus sp. SN-8-1 TaxID=3435409 RepID=UPI003D9A0BCD